MHVSTPAEQIDRRRIADTNSYPHDINRKVAMRRATFASKKARVPYVNNQKVYTLRQNTSTPNEALHQTATQSCSNEYVAARLPPQLNDIPQQASAEGIIHLPPLRTLLICPSNTTPVENERQSTLKLPAMFGDISSKALIGNVCEGNGRHAEEI